MVDIVIYTKNTCPYCDKAKFLLTQKNQQYKEINLNDNPQKIDEMREKSSGAMTVPQIFINGQHVEGGCDGLYNLEENGKLDEMLS